MRRAFSQPDAFERRGGSSAPMIGKGAAEFHREHDVFERGERREQLEKLKDDADFFAAPFRERVFALGVDVKTVHEHIAFVGFVDSADKIEQRGFAAPRRSDNRDEFARADVE